MNLSPSLDRVCLNTASSRSFFFFSIFLKSFQLQWKYTCLMSDLITQIRCLRVGRFVLWLLQFPPQGTAPTSELFHFCFHFTSFLSYEEIYIFFFFPPNRQTPPQRDKAKTIGGSRSRSQDLNYKNWFFFSLQLNCLPTC